jgi:hypothetical protein
MKAVLDSDSSIGLVAGELFNENGTYFSGKQYNRGLRFDWKPPVLFRRAAPKQMYDVQGIKYLLADQVINFFLAKTALFDDVRWDSRILIEYEHMDFFIEMKKTGWKAAACIEAKGIHLKSKIDPVYMSYRLSRPKQYFLAKHKIGSVINQFH